MKRRTLTTASGSVNEASGEPTEAPAPKAGARTCVAWGTTLAAVSLWQPGQLLFVGFSGHAVPPDLAARIREGRIGGVILFDVSQSIPAGPIRLGSPEWHALFKHTITEAARLGLQVSVHNAPGYTSSGGPWIGGSPPWAKAELEMSRDSRRAPKTRMCADDSIVNRSIVAGARGE